MPSSSPVKVFLAEDSAPIRQRVAANLAHQGMAVVGEGDTPSACIAGILSSQPDVVVLDIHLEGGTGLQVLRAVRGRDAHPAFVVFSNTAEPAYRKRYLAAGAASFVDKSCELEQLALAVQAASHHAVH
jgi:DNA-binding NarL/FixJ family response regulator